MDPTPEPPESPESPESPETHRVIGDRYALVRQIGQGGMGAVWLARDQVLGREVALKRIGHFPGGDTPGLVRAQREANLAARLNHPHVVAVFDFVSEGEEQWLVMEHVVGADLASLVADDGGLRPEEAARLLAQVTEALAAAHEAGIVHRDVKPSNILVTADGTAKLTDFGIARARDSTITASGMVAGSPAYLAPEVAAGRPATEASDVWSLGATLYQALSGRQPYESDNVMSAMYRIVHEDPPRLPGSGWPADLLEHTMATDPSDRWPMSRVHSYLADGPPAAPPTSREAPPAAATTTLLEPVPPVAPEPVRRGRLLPVLLAVGAVLVAAVLVWWLLRPDPAPNAGDDTASDEPTSQRSPSSSASRTPSPSSTAPPSSSAPATSSASTTATSPAPGNPAGAMRRFVQRYIATALADPADAWTQLSPRFQQDCCDGDEGSYAGYWDTIEDATLSDVVADPRAMTVAYTITWDPVDRSPEDEDVTLVLVRDGEGYLIDEER
jgi:serine/threonine protein kinase